MREDEKDSGKTLLKKKRQRRVGRLKDNAVWKYDRQSKDGHEGWQIGTADRTYL